MNKQIIFIAIVVLVFAGVGVLVFFQKQQGTQIAKSATQTQTSQGELTGVELDSFAKRLTEKGIKMYGSYICSACLAQIKMFGGYQDSFRHINYVECHPRGPNPQTELCLKRKINKTPTWILEKDGEEVKRLEGLQTFEDLAEFAGTPLREAK